MANPGYYVGVLCIVRTTPTSVPDTSYLVQHPRGEREEGNRGQKRSEEKVVEDTDREEKKGRAERRERRKVRSSNRARRRGKSHGVASVL